MNHSKQHRDSALTGDSALGGFNVIGHLSTSSGLGNAARLLIKVLRKQGYGVGAMDIDYDGNAEHQPIEGVTLSRAAKDLPYDHNILVVSLLGLPTLWTRRHPELLAPRFRNAGWVFWELPVIPHAWCPALALFDAILTSSQFVRHAIEIAVPEVPTLHAEFPLLLDHPDDNKAAIRARWGIPENAFTCCTSFDLRSDHSRKNPEATVKAFLQAFPNHDDARLVIKTNHATNKVSTNERTRALVEAINANPRIIVITDTIPYADVLALYSACDVFISLHRAEGLGLGPMEAMSLGKLVVATGFSGNMAYMTEQNSIPVPYRLIEPLNVTWQYRRSFAGRTASWAEPDVGEAARALRRAHDEPGFLKAICVRAANDIAERQVSAWRASYLGPLTAALRSSDRVQMRDSLAKRVKLMEISDPVMRKLNAQTVLDRVRDKVLKTHR